MSPQTQKEIHPLTITKQDVELATQQGPAAQAAESSPGGKPHIVIATPIYDAGEVWEGDAVVHSFVVKNTGSGVLTIGDVKPG